MISSPRAGGGGQNPVLGGRRCRRGHGRAAAEPAPNQRVSLLLFTPLANLTARSISLGLGFCPGSAGKSRDRPEPGGWRGWSGDKSGEIPPSPAGKRQLCHDLFFFPPCFCRVLFPPSVALRGEVMPGRRGELRGEGGCVKSDPLPPSPPPPARPCCIKEIAWLCICTPSSARLRGQTVNPCTVGLAACTLYGQWHYKMQ